MTALAAEAHRAESNRSAVTRSQIDVVVKAISETARETNVYHLCSEGPMPSYEPGAHVDLHLPNGIVRSYSLIPPTCFGKNAYAIAVKRDPKSRGGSQYIHEQLHVGDHIRVGLPGNNFPLADAVSHSVFFAGGIGITPIWCMIHHLNTLNRSWSLYYSARSRVDMAFIDEFAQDDRAHLHFDDESRGKFLEIRSIIADIPKDRQLYCCGPAPMLEAFEAATADWPGTNIHTEYFSARHEAAKAGGFTVCLARSERELFVSEGKTILQVLLGEGLDIDCSCEVGICGTCAQRVISGVPDHRDSVLSAEDRDRNDRIIVCCSGSRSDRLVLDL